MGDCRYCGKPAGFLRHQHPDCRRLHDETAAEIPGLFVYALRNSTSASEVRLAIEQDAAQNYVFSVERHRLFRSGIVAMIKAALADGALTDADDKRIRELQDVFGISSDALGVDGQPLVKARILHALDAGKPTTIKVSVEGKLAPHLEAEERAIWAFDKVQYLTWRTHTKYVGRSSGVSIRLMRGVYYHVGAFRGEPLKMDLLDKEDDGGLTHHGSERLFCREASGAENSLG